MEIRGYITHLFLQTYLNHAGTFKLSLSSRTAGRMVQVASDSITLPTDLARRSMAQNQNLKATWVGIVHSLNWWYSTSVSFNIFGHTNSDKSFWAKAIVQSCVQAEVAIHSVKLRSCYWLMVWTVLYHILYSIILYVSYARIDPVRHTTENWREMQSQPQIQQAVFGRGSTTNPLRWRPARMAQSTTSS